MNLAMCVCMYLLLMLNKHVHLEELVARVFVFSIFYI